MAMMEMLSHRKEMEYHSVLSSPASRLICIHYRAGLTRLVAGDVIRCGIDFTLSKAFYTKNGVLLGAFPSLRFDHTYAP